LPQRINNYFGQIPTNQTADSKRLEQLEAQVDGIQDKLAQLEKWKDNVHNYLGAIKEAQPSGERERAEDESLV
jgi:prefoldin subunit 5